MTPFVHNYWNLKPVLTVEQATTGAIISTPPHTLAYGTPDMLDAFIIEKIQKERDLRDSGREQLHIEIRRDRLHDERARKEEKTEERGIAIIDFNI